MKIVEANKVINVDGHDAPIGSIVRYCRHGKKSYIVVDANKEDGRRCMRCDLHGGNCWFVNCSDYQRRDRKNVILKLYSIGRLSREKIIYKDEDKRDVKTFIYKG